MPSPPLKRDPRPSHPADAPAHVRPGRRPVPVMTPTPQLVPAAKPDGGIGLGVAASSESGGVVTARKAGGLLDVRLDVNPDSIGAQGALQHLAKAVNIAFQDNVGQNALEAVYQAAVLMCGEVRIIHKEYFGFQPTWFGQLGRLLKSLGLTFQGPDPASPEGQKRIAEHGPSSIRGLLNFIGRKTHFLPEFEDRVPAFVEQMFDRLEATGIIVGWDRNDWVIWTTKIGLDIRIAPRAEQA